MFDNMKEPARKHLMLCYQSNQKKNTKRCLKTLKIGVPKACSKASTLWSLYSLIAAVINVNKNIEIESFPRLINSLQ